MESRNKKKNGAQRAARDLAEALIMIWLAPPSLPCLEAFWKRLFPADGQVSSAPAENGLRRGRLPASQGAAACHSGSQESPHGQLKAPKFQGRQAHDVVFMALDRRQAA